MKRSLSFPSRVVVAGVGARGARAGVDFEVEAEEELAKRFEVLLYVSISEEAFPGDNGIGLTAT